MERVIQTGTVKMCFVGDEVVGRLLNEVGITSMFDILWASGSQEYTRVSLCSVLETGSVT